MQNVGQASPFLVMKGVVLKRKAVHMTGLRVLSCELFRGSEQSEEVRDERWGMDALNMQT